MSFTCGCCRKTRQAIAHEAKLSCCGEPFILCQERCAEMIPRICKQTLAEYATDFAKFHSLVCRGVRQT